MLQRTSAIQADNATGADIRRRRALFAGLVGVTIVALLALAFATLSAGGFGFLDAVLLGLFALTTPWTVVGFWNAAIGFIIVRFSKSPPAPSPALWVDPGFAGTSSTAIIACIRNEDPHRILRNLRVMLQDIFDAGQGRHFHVYILSDTSYPQLDAVEQAEFEQLADEWRERIAITYRRRETNTNYKAGNISDFCERWGARHDFALVLDADSFMSAAAILRLVTIAECDPRIGIVQSLVVGLPSTSAFTRIFQFGMRLGMRSFTLGSAWWQADCGPYWGHNALLRLAPFVAHAQLPALTPGEKPILSHDQIEAVLMRSGGYHVRVLADETESYEENPPNLVEFIQRDERWCRGNMQYWRFLTLPGLKPVSRLQLLFAILMFAGSPGWIGIAAIGTMMVALADRPSDVIRPDAGLVLFVAVLLMWFAPKIATVADVVTRPAAADRFGGRLIFLAGVAVEMAFFILLSPILWIGHVLLFLSIPFGRSLGWSGQIRDDNIVTVRHAMKVFWLHTLFGVACLSVLAFTHPATLPYAFVLLGGPALSIPLAVLTSRPGAGRALMRSGVCSLPEEVSPSPLMRALKLPALSDR